MKGIWSILACLLWLNDAAERAEKTGSEKSRMAFPGKDWPNASPQSQGVDPAKLQAAIDSLGRGLKEYGGAGSIFIVRNGQQIYAGPEADREHQIYSATKSFTSVDQATSVQVPATIPNDDLRRSRGAGVYGYNWWVNGVKPSGQRLWPGAPPRTFYANGLHNNVCIVIPEWSMVIARTNGGRKDGSANSPANVDEVWSGFFARLAEAVSDSRGTTATAARPERAGLREENFDDGVFRRPSIHLPRCP